LRIEEENTMSLDQMTLSERYTRAMNSSHLEVIERRRGDVDVLIAAGWTREWLGTSLYRLASEFDASRGDQVVARRNAPSRDEMHRVAQRLEHRASASRSNGWIADASELSCRARELRVQAEREAASELAFILMKLKSLNGTKEQVAQWALEQAARRNFMPLPAMPAEIVQVQAWRREVSERTKIIMTLSGRAIEAFLDSQCHKCTGRGFSGGFGTPQVICRSCSGSGRRAGNLGRTEEERAFAAYLLSAMERMLARVERQMRHFLAARAAP
jgi:hypothetical protein